MFKGDQNKMAGFSNLFKYSKFIQKLFLQKSILLLVIQSLPQFCSALILRILFCAMKCPARQRCKTISFWSEQTHIFIVKLYFSFGFW